MHRCHSSSPHPPGEWPWLALASRNGGAGVGGGSGSKERSAGTLNTDSSLARGGQKEDTAQILSSQKKKKMARNRKRESCQLEAG